MTPWKMKENIDVAHLIADRNGFKLVWDNNYGATSICIQTKGNNEHGFVNNITLNAFSEWEQVIAFFAGWEKAQLAKAIGKVLKPKVPK